jgi:SAM-dependent methyltransferase
MSGTQSTQYNAVQEPYDILRQGSITAIERVNIRSIVLPFVKDANVLDLACGSGAYSHKFIEWGASRVLGVDISSAMLEKAKALAQNYNDWDKVEFKEADCSKPIKFEGGPFDIVFGGWFLNYASTGEEMIDFWRNIYLNLKPGGYFVGITPPPSNDPEDHVNAEQRARPWPMASSGLYTTLNKHVDEGVSIHRHADTPVGDLDFDAFHLRKDVYIRAAKEAGFRNEIVWEGTRVPYDFMMSPEKYGEQSNGGASNEELATYAAVPHYGTIHTRK